MSSFGLIEKYEAVFYLQSNFTCFCKGTDRHLVFYDCSLILMRPNSETPFFYRFSRTLCCIILVTSCFGLDTFGSIVQFWMQFLLILATEHHNLKCQFLLGLLTGELCINLFPYLVNKKCNKNCVWAGYIFMSWRSILYFLL